MKIALIVKEGVGRPTKFDTSGWQQSTKLPPGGRKRRNVIIGLYQQRNMTSGATGVTHGPAFIA